MSVAASLGISSALALFALWRRALTRSGSLLAWALCLLICAAGGWTAFAVLTATLCGTMAADKLAGKRADPNGLRRKSGSRDAMRVLCNVGTGAMAMGLYLITGRPLFAVAFAGVMAESLADSAASKIGPLSKRHPRDICTGKIVPTGLSGGVTLLGSLAELVGAAVIAAIWTLSTGDLREGCIVLLAGFLGAMADSVLGSRVQGKFRCPVCGKITERTEHCGAETTLCAGSRAVTNDTVNLLSNLAAALIAALLTQLW